jgi:ABC-type antimicrobial peptide transport system permease subunit
MPVVRHAIAQVDEQLPLSDEQTLTALIDRSIGQERFILLVLANFALVALALAAVGVYGVIAYFVTQRFQEIGIRIALGAQQWDVVTLVTRHVLISAGAGVLVGLVVAGAGSRLLSRLLYEVQPTDIPTYATGAVTLLVIALLAAIVPAIRATRVSPAVALKPE